LHTKLKKENKHMTQEIKSLLADNKGLLNSDGYIQFDKSVKNESKATPLYWIDGLQLHEDGGVTAWLSSYQSEIIDPIALERIEDMAAAIKDELEHTIRCTKEVMPTIKDEMLFTNRSIFGDYEEHEYEVECQDGFATAVPTANELESNPKAPKRLELTYPKLNELGDRAKQSCLDYRGIYDEPVSSCSYADVCMKYGKIKKPAQGIAHKKKK